jgi:hypothetical protein
VSNPALSSVDLDRIERALGWRPTHWAPASRRIGGATAARLLVSTAEERAFVKLGTTELTAGWNRREHENYLTLAGPFLPRLLGFSDDGGSARAFAPARAGTYGPALGSACARLAGAGGLRRPRRLAT